MCLSPESSPMPATRGLAKAAEMFDQGLSALTVITKLVTSSDPLPEPEND